jgi:hypothetical protein
LIDKEMDEQTVIEIDEETDRWLDRHTDGWMDSLMNRETSGQKDV